MIESIKINIIGNYPGGPAYLFEEAVRYEMNIDKYMHEKYTDDYLKEGINAFRVLLHLATESFKESKITSYTVSFQTDSEKRQLRIFHHPARPFDWEVALSNENGDQKIAHLFSRKSVHNLIEDALTDLIYNQSEHWWDMITLKEVTND